MKRLILIAAFLIFATPVAAQTVTISQESFNKLVNAAESLVEAKDVIAKMLAERGASDAAIASALKTIEGWKALDEINNTIIEKQKAVIGLYEKTLNLYASLVEKLEARLMKPKSAWSKFLDGLKTVLTLAAGVVLGRGL
jgi:xanthine dehydrogenase molybdopterin-binding subunit B